MSKIICRLSEWHVISEDTVRLTYTDDTTIKISKTDFDKGFSEIINATKADVIKKFTTI